jgi:hypothetical protein
VLLQCWTPVVIGWLFSMQPDLCLHCCAVCFLLPRDLAQFRAVAQELLSSAAWQLAGQAAPQQLAAAAAEAASPVEVEEVLQALLAHAAALTATLKAALQLLEDDSKQEQASHRKETDEAAAAAAAAAGPEQLQAELQRLAAGVAALRSAAAAARAPFGWEDGPLVVAMRRGQLLLVDELNLAEDAVLERLNRCGSCCVGSFVAHAVFICYVMICWVLVGLFVGSRSCWLLIGCLAQLQVIVTACIARISLVCCSRFISLLVVLL